MDIGEFYKEMTSLLVEGKSVGTFRGMNVDRRMAANLAAAVDPGAQRRRQRRTWENRKKLRSVVVKLGNRMVRTWEYYRDAHISKKRMESSIKQLLQQAYKQAYRLGMASGEIIGPSEGILTADDKQWLDSFKQQEYQYLKKLFHDISHGTSKTRIEKRLKRYAETVNAVFDSSRILGQSPTTEVGWVTHNIAPCKSCVELRRYGPYTIYTLPTVPKAGATLCLDNCKCTLEMKQASPERILELTEKNLKVQTLLRRLQKIKTGR